MKKLPSKWTSNFRAQKNQNFRSLHLIVEFFKDIPKKIKSYLLKSKKRLFENAKFIFYMLLGKKKRFEKAIKSSPKNIANKIRQRKKKVSLLPSKMSKFSKASLKVAKYALAISMFFIGMLVRKLSSSAKKAKKYLRNLKPRFRKINWELVFKQAKLKIKKTGSSILEWLKSIFATNKKPNARKDLKEFSFETARTYQFIRSLGLLASKAAFLNAQLTFKKCYSIIAKTVFAVWRNEKVLVVRRKIWLALVKISGWLRTLYELFKKIAYKSYEITKKVTLKTLGIMHFLTIVPAKYISRKIYVVLEKKFYAASKMFGHMANAGRASHHHIKTKSKLVFQKAYSINIVALAISLRRLFLGLWKLGGTAFQLLKIVGIRGLLVGYSLLLLLFYRVRLILNYIPFSVFKNIFTYQKDLLSSTKHFLLTFSKKVPEKLEVIYEKAKLVTNLLLLRTDKIIKKRYGKNWKMGFCENLGKTPVQFSLIGASLAYIIFVMSFQFLRHDYGEPLEKLKEIPAESTPYSSQVEVGMYINNFPIFSFEKNEFIIDSSVWFKFDIGTESLETIDRFSFKNADILSKSRPIIRQIGNKILVNYQVKISLQTYLTYRKYPFTGHRLKMVLENRSVSTQELVMKTSKENFNHSSNLLISNWSPNERHISYGYSIGSFSEKNADAQIEYPSVSFTLDFDNNSVRAIASLYLPMLLLFFICLFSFLTAILDQYKMQLIAASMPILILFRVVIDAVAPARSNFTHVDYTYFSLIALSFIILIFNTYVMVKRKRVADMPASEKEPIVQKLRYENNGLFVIILVLLMGVFTVGIFI